MRANVKKVFSYEVNTLKKLVQIERKFKQQQFKQQKSQKNPLLYQTKWQVNYIIPGWLQSIHSPIHPKVKNTVAPFFVYFILLKLIAHWESSFKELVFFSFVSCSNCFEASSTFRFLLHDNQNEKTILFYVPYLFFCSHRRQQSSNEQKSHQ